MRYITGGRPTSREELRDDVLPAFLRYYERFPGYGFWAAVEKATGQFLGWFHLRPPEGASPDEPELGYRLRRSAWGKGYATEGSRALVRVAFTELGARRVYAETMAGVRRDDGGQPRLPAGDGEGRPAAGPEIPPALAGADRG